MHRQLKEERSLIREESLHIIGARHSQPPSEVTQIPGIQSPTPPPPTHQESRMKSSVLNSPVSPPPPPPCPPPLFRRMPVNPFLSKFSRV
jgi:hypothetical protein